MTDRVSSSRPSSAPPPAGGRTAQAPVEAPGFDQAAQDFAALLGADEERRAGRERPAGQEDATETRDAGPPQRTSRKQQRGDEGEGGDDAEGDSSGESPTAEPLPLGELILKGFASHDAPELAGLDSRGAAPLPMDAIVQQVADRILVTPPGSGAQEVRILLKDSVLPGAEIRISQQAGQLQVQLVTDSVRTQQLLAQHQDALQQQLTSRLGNQSVVVQVELDAQGQPDRDGRSRNQRQLWEETQENA